MDRAGAEINSPGTKYGTINKGKRLNILKSTFTAKFSTMNTNSSSRDLTSRLFWAFLALVLLAVCGYVWMHHSLHGLPPKFRVLAMGIGFVIALVLMVKMWPSGSDNTPGVEEKTPFPSPALVAMNDAQDALQNGFVALNSHGRVVMANTFLENLLDLRETGTGAGLARVLHPDDANQFKNVFHEVCQSASGAAALKFRGFDKIQQLHYFQVAIRRWKESPAVVIAMLNDISEQEQQKHELQTTRAALHDLHGVFAGDVSGLLDTMRAILELGKLHFRVDLGLVARLQESNPSQLEVMQVLSAHEEISRGDIFDPLMPSHSHFPRVLAHAGFINVGGDVMPPPIFKVTRQETFLGAPIHVQGRLFGVLCFASPQSRPEGFSSSEMELVQFIAHWLGQEIERRQVIENFETKQRNLTEANASLETLLRDDLLTGLANKMALDDRLEQEFVRAREFALPLSVLVLTPNGIKEYRQKYGEAPWRTVLERVSAVLEQHTRAFDIAARYQDSTFVLVLPQADAKLAAAMAENIRAAVAQMSCPHQYFTASMGLVTLDAGCAQSQELLQHALDACQMAQMHSPNS